MSFIFAKDEAEVLDAALQPMDAPKAEKPKNGARLKTMETAPPSADITANVPSMASAEQEKSPPQPKRGLFAVSICP